LNVKAKIKSPIMAGIISKKQVKLSFGFVIDQTRKHK
jgi:hypothetical protein